MGDTEGLADFMAKHLETDVKDEYTLPKLGKVENTLVEFNCDF